MDARVPPGSGSTTPRLAPSSTPPSTTTEWNPEELEYERPWMYPKQFEAVFDGRRYSLIEASTKSGKTLGCLIWLIEQAIQGAEGWSFWWIAPVSVQADIAFRRALQMIPREYYRAGATHKTIVLTNG